MDQQTADYHEYSICKYTEIAKIQNSDLRRQEFEKYKLYVDKTKELEALDGPQIREKVNRLLGGSEEHITIDNVSDDDSMELDNVSDDNCKF